MNEREKERFLLHARLRAFRHRIEQAEGIARSWLMRCRRPVIAVSGGKDSTVMLDVVRRLRPDAPALFSDDEWLLPETEAYIATIPNLHRIAATIMHTEWFWSWVDGPEGLRPNTEWVEAERNDGSGTWMRLHGYDGVAVGLREEENSYRRVHIRAMGACFLAQGKGIWQAYPVAWLSTTDIWAYIISRGIVYNRAYDRLSEIGVPIEQQRIGPLANRRVIGYGQLAILRRGWPELFNRFAAEFPEARAFV